MPWRPGACSPATAAAWSTTTGEVVRHHRGDLWITCAHRVPGLAAPARRAEGVDPDRSSSTTPSPSPPVTARAACAGATTYLAYRDGRVRGVRPPSLNRRLAEGAAPPGPRHRPAPRPACCGSAPIDALPDGTVIVDDDGAPSAGARRAAAALLLRRLGRAPSGRRRRGEVQVLTPPTSVTALRNGFTPVLHALARRPGSFFGGSGAACAPQRPKNGSRRVSPRRTGSPARPARGCTGCRRGGRRGGRGRRTPPSAPPGSSRSCPTRRCPWRRAG